MGSVARGAKVGRMAGLRPRVVWVTRARPGAEVTAAKLRELGMEAVVEPLLEVRRTDTAPIDLAGVSAIAFTSANAVAAFAERSPERSLRVFAVGDATAAAARAQRFTSVLSAQGDVQALAAALAARKRELPGLILYPAAADPAQDLAGALEAVGLQVRQVTLYETVSLEPSQALVEGTAANAGRVGPLGQGGEGADAVPEGASGAGTHGLLPVAPDRPPARPRRPRRGLQRRDAERAGAAGAAAARQPGAPERPDPWAPPGGWTGAAGHRGGRGRGEGWR